MSPIRLGTTLALATFAAAGCVSQGKYDKLAQEKSGEIAALQAEQKRIQGETQKLQEEVKALESQRATLESQRASLESQRTALEQDNAVLQQEKAALQQERTADEQTKAQYAALVVTLGDEVKKGELQVRQYKDMLTVDVADQVFFDSGRASLKASGRSVLDKVAAALKGFDDKFIRVVGHTDNVPIAKAYQTVFPSNWELSAARATTVVRYLQQAGVPAERMIASGRAEYEPVAENNTEDGRRKNRRIEISLINQKLVQEVTQSKH